LLEWPARAVQPASRRELANARTEKRGNPLDAQAYVPDDSGTFEALWRDRIQSSTR